MNTLNISINAVKLIYWQIVVPYRTISLLGVFLLFTIIIQIITGTMVSFGAINDCILLPQAREEDDMGDLYNDDFYYYHERGVDFIFIFLYLHLFRKIFLKASYFLQQTAWKSGALMYLLIHGIIFFGLVLCCTHLSDITLKIAANIAQTITFKYGKIGYWLFTDNTLNTDTLIRLMYIHYILPFVLLFISFSHLLDMHYNWKDSNLKKWLNISF